MLQIEATEPDVIGVGVICSPMHAQHSFAGFDQRERPRFVEPIRDDVQLAMMFSRTQPSNE
nr:MULTISPECIES: hypothetical protein [Rhizobium]